MINTNLGIAGLQKFPVRRTKGKPGATAKPDDVTALAAMLDYVIVEGVMMRLPMFVCLLRLALMALREESAALRDGRPQAAP